MARVKGSTKSCLESYVFQELIKDSRAKVLRPYSQATRRNTIFQSESFLGASVALGFCICFFFGPKANTSVQIMVESKYIFVEAIYPFITFFIHLFISLFIKHLLCARICLGIGDAAEKNPRQLLP